MCGGGELFIAIKCTESAKEPDLSGSNAVRRSATPATCMTLVGD